MPAPDTLDELTDAYGGQLPDPTSISVPPYFKDLFLDVAGAALSVVTDNLAFIFLGMAILISVGFALALFHVHKFGRGVKQGDDGQLEMKM